MKKFIILLIIAHFTLILGAFWFDVSITFIIMNVMGIVINLNTISKYRL
jgi:hypothetical protein